MSESSLNPEHRAVIVARPAVSTWWPTHGLFTLAALLLLIAALAQGYRLSAHTVTLVINGTPIQIRTHQQTLGGLLAEQGLTLRPEDVLIPGAETRLSARTPLELHLAREITFDLYGVQQTVYSHAPTVADFLYEQGVSFGAEDRLYLDGTPITPETPLPTADFFQRPRAHVELVRATPLLVDLDGITLRLFTRAETLAQALREEGITLYPEDIISPRPNTPVAPNMHVSIRRATPFSVQVDGQTLTARTHAPTVGDALAELGVSLSPLDRVEPPLETALTDDTAITITRVEHEIIVERETIPFQRVLVPDPTLEIDTFAVREEGAPGTRAREILVVYENGEEKERIVQREWVEQEPVNRVVAYGTNIVIRTLDTPNGPIQYWRRTRMLATSYTAASSGKPKDHPRYGITRTGLPAGYGIVAVDPRVVPLWTQVYVPGYGQACACDTGGGVIGAWIDLGYDEDNYKPWYRWVDVYWVAPPPPPDRIQYILPTAQVP